jgi:signal transduction histidine kinase
MKKVALVFVLAVIVPSLVLAWLAVRSVRDQRYALERERSLLYQGVADGFAKEAASFLNEREHDFVAQVQTLLATQSPHDLALEFDDRLRTNWPFAQVGFAVNLNGQILSPSPQGPSTAKLFLADNAKFLGNRETVEVYWNYGKNDEKSFNSGQTVAQNTVSSVKNSVLGSDENNDPNLNASPKKFGKMPQLRNVVPQQQAMVPPIKDGIEAQAQQYSKLSSSEAEFRQLIGDETEGTLARFLDNRLNVLCWYRPRRDTNLVFGAQFSLAALQLGLKHILDELETALREEIAVAVLNDAGKPIAVSRSAFEGNWKHPFVSTEIGESLPHWEVAVYLLDPGKLSRSANLLRLTLGLLIVLLLLSIAVGSWLIVNDLKRQLVLASQKTDFVSNVSHELKTPLTSIRMFSELLAEGRVTDPAKRQSYLHIISAESSRLTRLINNVLDFSRMERGEKKYDMRRLDVVALIRDTAETYRPHLEAAGFTLECDLAPQSVEVKADRDALAQIVVNLLSNAEKYSGPKKEISVKLKFEAEPLRVVEMQVLDRGLGVPHGCEARIFEKFYRAHNSLSSGIQGSGLGLTIARQIARAHGGDLTYQAREGGGSSFILRLPVVAPDE